MTFTASGTGGTAPYSFKWWLQRNGGVWTEMSTWTTTPTWTWTPTQAGNYVIGIWGRSAGNSADRPQAIGTTSYEITGSTTPPPPPPVGVVPSATIAAGLSSPRPVGTTVAFTSSVSGGTSPHSFKYWIQKDGGAWTMVRDWSTSAVWNWTAPQSGNYVIGVWVRNAGAVLDIPQTIATLPFVIAAAGMPTSSLAASSNNVRVGTPVTLTAGATGGVGPHSFKWWVQKDGGAWTEVQGWSTTTTFAWTPTSPGIYVFGIWGRNAGVSANAAQTIATTPIVVSP